MKFIEIATLEGSESKTILVNAKLIESAWVEGMTTKARLSGGTVITIHPNSARKFWRKIK